MSIKILAFVLHLVILLSINDQKVKRKGKFMFALIRKIFIIYFLCITLAGFAMIFIDSKFTEQSNAKENQNKINQHKIEPNLIMFTSSIGGFLGVYAGIWIFNYDKNNFYLNWGNLIILIYNIALIITVYSKSHS